MGKDKAKDGDAATSTDASRDHSWEQESRDAALANTIAKAVAGVFTKQKAKRQSSSLKHSQGRWRRLRHSMKSFKRQVMLKTSLLPLRLLQVQMVLELWTPLTGQWTKTSTRDGSYGHTRQDLH